MDLIRFFGYIEILGRWMGRLLLFVSCHFGLDVGNLGENKLKDRLCARGVCESQVRESVACERAVRERGVCVCLCMKDSVFLRCMWKSRM